MTKIKLGVIISEFNYDITYLMLQKALDHIKMFGAEAKIVIKVPGAFEIPLALSKIIKRSDIDGVVTLGAVIQGETEHDDVVAHQVVRKIIDISIENGKPVALGIIGPGATRAQAQARIEEYAKRAVEAVIKMIYKIKQLEELKDIEECIEI